MAITNGISKYDLRYADWQAMDLPIYSKYGHEREYKQVPVGRDLYSNIHYVIL